METVGQFITFTSTQMNDQRHGRAFTRWGRAHLLQYLNLGLTEIATYRPEAFAKDEEITLAAGATQHIDPSKSLVALSSNLDGTPILKGDIDMATSFNAYSVCPIEPRIINGVARYLVRSYARDGKNSHKFYVDPPVPAGLVVSVHGTVTGEPKQYTLADWNEDVELESKYDASLIDYMMACAHGLDIESREARANSQALYRKFYEVMGVKYKQESKYQSGYYLGETGNGDPRAGR